MQSHFESPAATTTCINEQLQVVTEPATAHKMGGNVALITLTGRDAIGFATVGGGRAFSDV